MHRSGLLGAVTMVKLPSDENFTLQGKTLRQRIEKDKSEGKIPFFVSFYFIFCIISNVSKMLILEFYIQIRHFGRLTPQLKFHHYFRFQYLQFFDNKVITLETIRKLFFMTNLHSSRNSESTIGFTFWTEQSWIVLIVTSYQSPIFVGMCVSWNDRILCFW